MPGSDPGHWLHRLTAEEWLRAAEGELARAERALADRQHRAGVTQARRAAGMAWNAVLALGEDPRYGRSYMDHLARLRDDEAVARPVREAAGGLLDVKLALEVIPLGRGDTRAAGWARTILEAARERVQPTAKA